ncbi:MAG: transketolase C-terminal domain-containing protein [Clostridia bacterium]|nr:transketolase C-terminal domain-containing protein [Clostridia bacterium]
MKQDIMMRDILVDFLQEKIKTDDRVVVVDADLAKCSTTLRLEKEFPDRAYNVGIAEANMTSVAAGLASYGFIPFVHSFAPFATRRSADQVMISVCYAKQNVKIIGTDPGITAELNGGTHMPFEDIGMLRSIPNLVIYEPTDVVEFEQALPQILEHVGPVYVRMHRKNPPIVMEEGREFNLFKAYKVCEGKDVTIVASGIMVSTAKEAALALSAEGISVEIICCPTVKPIDEKTILDSAKKTGAVVTAENHNVMGALRSAVCEVLSENYPVPVRSVGIKEKFGEVGKLSYLRKVFNMESADIVKAVKEVLSAK